ncbi:MAG: hypothetical protein IPG76_22000 [Acidobacteria bacterium]|nr:hypothetical protein [Acidobacteriota bacterium]
MLRKGDYGVGVTIAIYQFDDARSKRVPAGQRSQSRLFRRPKKRSR